MGFLIQRLVLPNLTFGASADMYVRVYTPNVRVRLSSPRVLFSAGGCAYFDTFFNALSVGVWKKNTSFQDLHLTLRGHGRFVLRFGLHRLGQSQRWLSEQEIELSEAQSAHLEVLQWPQLQEGLLYFYLEALDDGSYLSGGEYHTHTSPLREVKLGMVITHFNRKAQVLPAIDRIRRELLSDPLYRNKIELVVVDNSRTLTPEETAGVTLLPNANFGGSGGFSRGLIHLQDHQHTHCLFMDDDASCEVEAIRRTYALLSFATTERFAVAGSLLRELEPARLFEKGALFNGLCRPLKRGLDMKRAQDLLLAEQTDRRPDYGGWWFFAFEIASIHHWPFPFFVRGDDVQFSMLNKFNIATMNAIACWGDDFGLKSGPLPIYLDVRSHLFQAIAILKFNRWQTLKLAAQFFAASAFSYNYGTAEAVITAMRHFMRGKTFWTDNLDTTAIRQEIGQYSALEKMSAISRDDFDVQYRDMHETRLRKYVRRLTLNGYLLPSFLLRKGPAFQPKDFRAKLREIFRFKEVLFEYEPTGVGYLARHDKKAFFRLTAKFLQAAYALYVAFPALQKECDEAIEEFTDSHFWRDIYKQHGILKDTE
jgi:hypothetical protein